MEQEIPFNKIHKEQIESTIPVSQEMIKMILTLKIFF